MCQQTFLRFQILLRETISNSISLRHKKKSDKSLCLRFQECLVHFSMLTVEGYSEAGHLSNEAFWQFLISVTHKL